jgi:hypothetical protein
MRSGRNVNRKGRLQSGRAGQSLRNLGTLVFTEAHRRTGVEAVKTYSSVPMAPQ